MADISTGRQRGIVPFVDETTGRLPDQYLPQGVIDLQGDLEQAVSDASQSATAAKASETAAKASADSATQSASAAAQSAESASDDATAAKASADGAASSAGAAKASETAAASSATAAKESKDAAKASETAAARSAQTATEQVSSIGDSVEQAAASATAAQQSASQAQSSATVANSSAQAAAASAESAQTATESAASSKDAAARSASEASASASAAEASKTNAAASAAAAEALKTSAAASASAAKASETNAAASATAAQQAVDGFGLQVGTTTTGEPGTDAAVEIQKQGTKYTANFTIPRGDKGADGVNENVPLGAASGIVAQASDAYPALPRKVQVHGRTIENLCPVFNTVDNGVTFSTDANGYISIKGTATGDIYEQPPIANLPPNTKVWIYVDSDFRAKGIANVYAQSSEWSLYADVGRAVSSTTKSHTDGRLIISIASGVTVDTKIRVMFVASETEPDANLFVPSGVHTVEPTKLIAAGKNLASVTSNSNNPNLLISDILPPGDYVFSAVGDILERGYNLRAGSLEGPDIAYGRSQTTKFSLTQYASIFLNMYNVGSITNIQIEKGASATRFEQPVKRETNLPPDISLADGDTLTIDRDGTTQIIHAEGEPTVLENVTLPELPAPTFNAYTTGGHVPPTVEVDYERDVNLVLEALEAKIAALQMADKTN